MNPIVQFDIKETLKIMVQQAEDGDYEDEFLTKLGNYRNWCVITKKLCTYDEFDDCILDISRDFGKQDN